MTIASVLVKNGARMDYIPPEELSRASPFVSTPAQSPIGEAARCGYSRIVQVRTLISQLYFLSHIISSEP
jgi:hypothetical protein